MSAQAESVRSSLRELEKLLEEHSPMMGGLTERALDNVLNYGGVFAEVRPAQWQPAQH